MSRPTESILTLVFSKLDRLNWLSTLFVCFLFLVQEVAEDISYIQSQNQGLQVQTQNQRALMAEIADLLVRFPPSRLLNVTDCFGCIRKPSMLTESLSSPSLKSRWRSRRASRNSKRLRRICTRHYRLDEIEVRRSFNMGSRMARNFLNLISRHGCRDGTILRIQDVQFPVLQADF